MEQSVSDTSTQRHILCNCENSMPVDSKTISKALGYDAALPVHTALCTQEQEVLVERLGKLQGQAIIACTQFPNLFSALAEEAGKPAPLTVNIREQAGWSDDAKQSAAKMAALLGGAADTAQDTKLLSLISHGRCLIYGGGRNAIALGKSLSENLGVTVMLEPRDTDFEMDSFDFTITTGTIKKASGSFTQFQLTIDNFAELSPASRGEPVFSALSHDVQTGCDILIDLTGGTPLFTGWQKRDGYFRADGDDVLKIEEIKSQAAEMIGEFEKPLYVKFDGNLCAHQRNKLSGCSRCLDVCPAGAISSAGDIVSIDPNICGGCGMCGAVCPSGAAQTHLPAIDTILGQIDRLARRYKDAGGTSPALLLHDTGYGDEVISALARFDTGLPAHLIPFAMHSVGRVGHDILLGAISSGFERIVILANPQKADENSSISAQIALAEAMLTGVSIPAENRFALLQEEQPEAISEVLWASGKLPAFTPAPVIALGGPRSITRTVMRGLAKANMAQANIDAENAEDIAIPLPAGAPYGKVDIDTEKCTICLSCVGACPAGALQDNPDAPQLLFREDACVQCGICTVTCPEKVISLVPQFNLSDAAMATELVIEDEPFHCTSCGKAFGTTRSIEAIIERLSGHSMFTQEGRLEMLKMCEDCRVGAIFTQDDKMLDVGERKKPRTTDDYLN